MRAWRCHEWCAPGGLTLEEVPSPPLAEGQVRIAIHAAGANFADNLLIGGKYQRRPERPFTPGAEAAGEVIETAPGVEGLPPGTPVVCTVPDGAFAEELVVSGDTVFALPPDMDFQTAAAVPVTYSTGYYGLAERGRLAAGETLLVLGAAGGVGLAAVELGKLLGARVIGVVSTDAKAELVRQCGAEDIIFHTRESIRERMLEISDGKGVDVVLDPVGGDAFDQAVRGMAWGGRLLVVGFASGRIPELPANLALLKSFDLVGVNWPGFMARDPSGHRAQMKRLLDWCAEETLKPFISRVFPLEQVPEAMTTFLERQVTGKVIIQVR